MMQTMLLRYRILRYGIVGGIAFSADAGFLYSLTTYFNVNYLFSAAGGFMLGLTINYLLSLRFVFADVEQRTKWTFQLFCFVGLIGLLLNELIMGLFTEYFGFYYLFSKMISVFLVFLWNYSARKKLCFQEAADHAQCSLHSRSGAGRIDSRL